VHALVAELGEEPKSLATWSLLDSHATRSELITRCALLLEPEPEPRTRTRAPSPNPNSDPTPTPHPEPEPEPYPEPPTRSRHELLVFLSIKRNDEARAAAEPGGGAGGEGGGGVHDDLVLQARLVRLGARARLGVYDDPVLQPP
jgi:hypothetical protein